MQTLLILIGSIVFVFGAFVVIRHLLAPLGRWLNDSIDRWLKWRDVRDTYQTRKLR